MKVFVQKVHHHFLPSLLLVIFENIPLKLGKGYTTVGLAKFLGRLKEILAHSAVMLKLNIIKINSTYLPSESFQMPFSWPKISKMELYSYFAQNGASMHVLFKLPN